MFGVDWISWDLQALATPTRYAYWVLVVCFTVLGGTARVHRTPARNGQDFLLPTGVVVAYCQEPVQQVLANIRDS